MAHLTAHRRTINHDLGYTNTSASPLFRHVSPSPRSRRGRCDWRFRSQFGWIMVSLLGHEPFLHRSQRLQSEILRYHGPALTGLAVAPPVRRRNLTRCQAVQAPLQHGEVLPQRSSNAWRVHGGNKGVPGTASGADKRARCCGRTLMLPITHELGPAGNANWTPFGRRQASIAPSCSEGVSATKPSAVYLGPTIVIAGT